jgi:hypothetical protein
VRSCFVGGKVQSQAGEPGAHQYYSIVLPVADVGYKFWMPSEARQEIIQRGTSADMLTEPVAPAELKRRFPFVKVGHLLVPVIYLTSAAICLS